MRLGSVHLACWAALLFSAACAGRVAPEAPGPPTQPRASWLIRTGSPGGRMHEVCRSDTRDPCVLEAGTKDEPRSVSVSLYLYDAGAKTNYSGAFLAEFIKGAKPIGHETQVDYSVEADTPPSAIAVVGNLKPEPGTYELRIFLFANVDGRTDPHQYMRSIPVTVI